MAKKQRKLFCDINPTCYAISEQKEIIKRHIKNFLSNEKIAKEKGETLPNIVNTHEDYLIKTGPGIDPKLQQNKVINIALAGSKINGIIIHPGETFSFWSLVGNASKRRGFKEGRVLRRDRLVSGVGGGLCNLANTINVMVLHSPLKITEFHTHSDALAADNGEYIPLKAGTSICYNRLDYRFINNTDQNVQILAHCENDTLFVELRSEKPFPNQYKLIAKDHYFSKEEDKYYRNARIYRQTLDSENKVIQEELILKNHSEVFFPYELIPKELIKN